MDNADLAWRVEEACMNAWPSPRQLFLDGWLVRASGGTTRRTNSVNPLRGGPRRASRRLAAFDAIYGSLGQAVVFRVPTIAEGMDADLASLGYAAEAETVTLFNDLDQPRKGAEGLAETRVELSDSPGAAWLAARTRLNGANAENARIYQDMLDAILLPRRFAATLQGDEIVALAYGALHDGLLVVESVVTAHDHRQRGHGARTVGALMEWARTQGAAGACLQVVADNSAARALYRSLGFERELYRYHYRRAPAAARQPDDSRRAAYSAMR